MGNASKDLGLDQTCLEDNNLKKILSGLSSIMDRVGGHYKLMQILPMVGIRQYKIQLRHV